MAGPWEDFQAAPAAGPSGPWSDFAPTVTATPSDRATRLSDAVMVGLQSSATGLALRGKLPDQQLASDAPWYMRLASNVAALGADVPLMVAGSFAGSAAGAGMAGPPGAAVGAAAGSFAAPMALRDALIEAYNNNHALSWAGVWDIAKAALKGGMKGAFIGAATAGAGRFATPFVEGAVAKTVVGTGAELAALTATSAAVEQHMPTWQDFMDNAILLGGMKVAIHTAKALRNVYAETGKTPQEALGDAMKDPEIKAALERGELPTAYQPLALEQRVQASLDYDPRPEAIRALVSDSSRPLKLGEAPVADPVRLEYVTDADTHKGLLRLITERYGTEIEKQRRGVVSNAQTLNEAKDMIVGGDLKPHEVGAAGNAAENAARLIVLRSAVHDTYSKLDALRQTPEAQQTPLQRLEAYAAIERLSTLKAEADGVMAEWGRAGQMVRELKRNPELMFDAQNLLNLVERKGKLQDIAEMAGRMKDGAQLAGFAQKYMKATFFEKVMEGWKAFILSGPWTQVANVLGNTAKWIVEIPENTVAATLTAIDKAAKGDPLTLAQWKARAFAQVYGVQHGAKESIYVASEVWKGQGPRVEKADVYRTAIEGKTGAIVRLPFKALQVEDVMFRTMAERAKAYEMAIDRVVKDGLHPDSFEARRLIAAYTADPGFGLSERAAAEAVNKVQHAGAQAVFAERLGPFMEMLQANIAKNAPALQFVVPFVRTPANLVSWAVQHTPGLNLLSARWRADFAAGGEARAKAISRVVIGTGLAMTAYSMAQNGTLTGGGLFDRELSRTKAGAGWQPYSIKVGDTWYSYQRIEPVAKVLGITADLMEMLNSKKLDEGDAAKASGMLVLMFSNATISTTYLSGLSSLINGVTDPERYGEPMIEQLASSFVPKLLGQTAAAMDPYKREVDGAIDAIQSQIPFLREKLLPKRDVWGEPTANDKWFSVMPIQVTKESQDKVRTEAMRLAVAINDAPRFVMEKAPFNAREKRTELKPEQRDIFREVSGKNAMEILSPIVNAPDWERIPDFAKAEIYKRVLLGTRKQGEYAALPPTAPERQAKREQLINKIIQQTSEAQGK